VWLLDAQPEVPQALLSALQEPSLEEQRPTESSGAGRSTSVLFILSPLWRYLHHITVFDLQFFDSQAGEPLTLTVPRDTVSAACKEEQARG